MSTVTTMDWPLDLTGDSEGIKEDRYTDRKDGVRWAVLTLIQGTNYTATLVYSHTAQGRVSWPTETSY